MPIRSLLACAAACGLALISASPAAAAVVSWRATGEVTSLQGTTALLPVVAMVGDPFVLEFSYDDASINGSPFPDRGDYPLLSLVASVGAQSVTFKSDAVGVGHIGIQANSVNPNVWGVSSCLPTCSNTDRYDTARLNFFFPVGTIPSEALTPPPDPAGATVQFGLFSRSATDEAFLIASLESVVPAPEAGAGAGVLAALAALSAVRCARARPSPRP
jgi:hypothetical protein